LLNGRVSQLRATLRAATLAFLAAVELVKLMN
jgi:hypothetical protein